MRKFILCFSFLCLFVSLVPAQQRKIDSLNALISADKPDTNMVKHLVALSFEYCLAGQIDKSFEICNKAVELAQKNGDNTGLAKAYGNMGLVYENQSDYPKALDYCLKGLKIAEQINNKDQIAVIEGSIGIIYDDQSNLPKAMEYYTKALKIKEQLGEKKGIARNNINIALLYEEQGDYPSALEYNFKGLKIAEEIGSERLTAVVTGNIGVVYEDEGDDKKALEYYEKAYKMYDVMGDKGNALKNLGNIGNEYETGHNYPMAMQYDSMALKMAEDIGSKSGVATNIGNIGIIYFDEEKYDKALECGVKAFAINKELGRRDQMAVNTEGIGSCYAGLHNATEAEKYFNISLAYSDSCHYLLGKKEGYLALSELYHMTGRWKEAYDNYRNYISIKDSLVNEDKSKQIGKLEAKADFDKQLALQQADDDKKSAITAEESKKQKLVILFVAAIALAVAIIAVVVFRALRVTRKQKDVIEIQKKEVEEQKSLVEQQKAIVDEKNSDITASIRYASRIQHALLTTEEYIGKHLEEYFIMLKPRDIVSGDFYWAFEYNGAFFLACCDCTGHGVPGAFMSLLNISMLNESIIERHITKPDLILNDIRSNVIKALNPDGKSETKDGMDCTLVSLNLKNNILQAACANNTVWIIRGDECIEFKPDKMPVGIQHGEQKPFTLHDINLVKGDCVYLFTDGYADQFGGPKGKKFKYKKLQELLIANALKPMTEQRRILDESFESWKGNLEQVDDVLIIGIRV